MYLHVESLEGKFGAKITSVPTPPINMPGPCTIERGASRKSVAFKEELKKNRLLIMEGEGQKLFPASNIIYSGGERKKSAYEEGFLFWHWDRLDNGYIGLQSKDESYRDQPITIFADLEDVIRHLQKTMPEFIARLDREVPEKKAQDPHPRKTLKEAFDALGEYVGGTPWLDYGTGNINREYLWVLRNASRAFGELLDQESDMSNDFESICVKVVNGKITTLRANTFLRYAYIVQSFQQYPTVRNFLKTAHQVPDSYQHNWRRNQTIAWDATDDQLYHSRIPQKPGIKIKPLHRIAAQHETERY